MGINILREVTSERKECYYPEIKHHQRDNDSEGTDYYNNLGLNGLIKACIGKQKFPGGYHEDQDDGLQNLRDAI